MTKKDIIILHGTYGSPDGNWFPWLKSQLEKEEHNVYIPKFPTPEGQSVKSWCDVLIKETPVFGKDTILIGHSCGATYLLHILEVVKEPVLLSVFVSGFTEKLGNEEYDNLNESFINHNFNWQKIRQNTQNILLYHGDNDPYVPLSEAEKLSQNLKTPITLIKNGGHINAESGFTTFPQLLSDINEYIGGEN